MDIRIMIRAKKLMNVGSIRIDPRVVRSKTANELILKLMENFLYKNMTEQSLHHIVDLMVTRIMDIHYRGEIEWLERPWLETKLLWKHDCDECMFLGNMNEIDYYYCKQSPIRPTLIARYGSVESQYISGAPFAEYVPEIWEAAVLAEAKGLGKFLSSRHSILLED